MGYRLVLLFRVSVAAPNFPAKLNHFFRGFLERRDRGTLGNLTGPPLFSDGGYPLADGCKIGYGNFPCFGQSYGRIASNADIAPLAVDRDALEPRLVTSIINPQR